MKKEIIEKRIMDDEFIEPISDNFFVEDIIRKNKEKQNHYDNTQLWNQLDKIQKQSEEIRILFYDLRNILFNPDFQSDDIEKMKVIVIGMNNIYHKPNKIEK